MELNTHSAAVAEGCQSVKDVQIAPSGGVESLLKVNLRNLKNSVT